MDQSKIERIDEMSRKIFLKDFATIGDQSIKGYADLLVVILKASSSPQGFNPDTMRQTLKLVDTIRYYETRGIETVVLDELDWEYIRNKVRVFPFKLAHSEVLEFIDSILDAEEVKLEEVTSDGEETEGGAA